MRLTPAPEQLRPQWLGGGRAHPVRLLLLRGDGTQRPLQVSDALLGRLQEPSEILRLSWKDRHRVQRRMAPRGLPVCRLKQEAGQGEDSHLFFAWLPAEYGPARSVILSSRTLGSLWSGYEPSEEKPNQC